MRGGASGSRSQRDVGGWGRGAGDQYRYSRVKTCGTEGGEKEDGGNSDDRGDSNNGNGGGKAETNG